MNHSIKSAAVLILGIILSFHFFLQSDASTSLSGYSTDNTTGWRYKSAYYHMGKRNTTYRFESSEGRTKYSSVIQNGSSLWAGSLTFTEGLSSAEGVIKLISDQSYLALTQLNSATNGHTTSWELYICINTFDALPSETDQNKVIAHEIGHIFGLDHVTNQPQIMYTPHKSNLVVHSYDRRGMNVMTDTHVHGSTVTSFRYEQITLHRHKKRCTTCFSYQTETCDYTSYQSGNYLYYEYDCSKCGHQATISYPIN